MNKLFIQKQNLNTRWIHLRGGAEAMGDNTELAQQRTEPVETAEAFIARHNEALNRRIATIPCPDNIRDLCHGNVADLITEASNPDFRANQDRLAADIAAEVNAGEGAQFAAAEGNPEARLSQEEVDAERAAREASLVEYLTQVEQALEAQAAEGRAEAQGDNEKMEHIQSIETRGRLMGAAAQTVQANGIDWANEVPFGGGNEALVAEAQGALQAGITEGTSAADELAGLDTASIPWCGAGLKGLCSRAGIELPGEINFNVAEAWVAPNGDTGEHVAMCSGAGKMIGCNQSNAITETDMPGNYRFNTVENLMAGIQTDLRAEGREPQPGDIIVTSRGAGDSDPVPADQNVA